jgi:hypothetical protein
MKDQSRFQCFRQERDDAEQPVLSIKLFREGIDHPYFERDMKRLTSRVFFSSRDDSEIVELLAEELGTKKSRNYEIFPTNKNANVSIEPTGRIGLEYSDCYETQLRIGRTSYTIKHNI